MTAINLSLCAAGLLLLACGSEPRSHKDQPQVPQVFQNLPLPPNPELVSRSGSEDALQLTLRSPADIDLVADYYRTALSRGKWRLVSDVKSQDGSATLYAEQDGPPLWVRIWKSEDRPGTMVQLTGALVNGDSLHKKKADSATVRRPTRS
jgi:hypothetical protein